MAKYRKKPVVIEAFRLGNDDPPAWYLDALDGGDVYVTRNGSNGEIVVDTLEGGMHAYNGDYIIKGIKDEIYPCKPDIFEATYEAVD